MLQGNGADEAVDIAGASIMRSLDHPRLRGETHHSLVSALLIKGPSPPARGNRRRFRPGQRIPGTIPACAGKPLE